MASAGGVPPRRLGARVHVPPRGRQPRHARRARRSAAAIVVGAGAAALVTAPAACAGGAASRMGGDGDAAEDEGAGAGGVTDAATAVAEPDIGVAPGDEGSHSSTIYATGGGDGGEGGGDGDGGGGRVSREELGQATWLLLHTMAAQWPDAPTRAQRRAAKEFILALQHVYPCAHCAKHFGELLKGA